MDEALYHCDGMAYQIYVPPELVEKIIWKSHNSYGHPGAEKTYKMLRESFYAPRLAKFTRKTLATCDSCQRNKLSTQAAQALQEPVLSKEPLEIISIDFFTPVTKIKYSREHLLVMIDTFTKYTKLYPLRRATSELAIKKLDEFIKIIGKPKKVLSDRGTQFTSHRWREALEERGIQIILTSIRHPQANMVEQVNRKLARLFRTLL